MSRHLSPREVVDALDGALAAARARHLETCEGCRGTLRTARETLRELNQSGAADVPEPSPLFWEHFQARVRERTEAVPLPGSSWWAWSWRALAVTAPALLAVMVVVTLGREDGRPVASVGAPSLSRGGVPEVAAVVPAAEPSVAAATVDVPASLPVEDLELVAPVRAGTAETWLEDFSVDERAELFRLLTEAMGGGR